MRSETSKAETWRAQVLIWKGEEQTDLGKNVYNGLLWEWITFGETGRLIIPGVGKQLLKWAPSYQTFVLRTQPQHPFKRWKPIRMPPFSAKRDIVSSQARHLTFPWKRDSLLSPLPLQVGRLQPAWMETCPHMQMKMQQRNPNYIDWFSKKQDPHG